MGVASQEQEKEENGRLPNRNRKVSSRYMCSAASASTSTSTSTSTSRRFSSPVLASRSTNSSRSRSVDRPRPDASHSESAAAKLLLNSTSTRSLSVSFQGEAFPLPFSKAKPATPDRRRPVDHHQHHRWPARTHPIPDKLVRNVPSSIDDDGRSLSLDLFKSPHGNSANDCDLTTASDSESVSSGSGSSTSASASASAAPPKGPRGIAVSARFWHETSSRLRRLQDPASPAASTSTPTPKATPLRRYNSEGPVLSPRTIASPVRGNTRPASPSKLWPSPAARGASSPARVRSAVASSINCSSSDSPSILCFSADIRRRKIGEGWIFNAHSLRLLYNRYVQWRFVNARADATFMLQTLNAERHIWNAWVTISELRHSVILKRVKLLLLHQKLKLTSILKGQMPYLEEWALLDGDHSSSLLGVTEALWASTLRLPVVEKAIANVPNLTDAVGSAVDVMQAMSSAIYTLSAKVEETNSLVMELVKLTAKERFLLEQCKDFLSSLAAIQVKDYSLRTQILQFCHALPAS